MTPRRQLKFVPVILPLLSLGALLSHSTARAEDVAIVTGIGEYGNLPNASLPGIDNDVNAMEGSLKGAFHVIKLWNGQATESGIRNAFGQAARLVGTGDRFVYYQSSHGTEDHHLLTYDTTTSGEHTLGAAEIKSLMSSIHTSRKSLIMDACFSGGLKAFGGAHVKFYPIRRFKSKDFERNTVRDRCDTVVRQYAGSESAPTGIGANSPFVIFASSQQNEFSEVVRIDGQPCSVFTHFLTEALNSAGGAKGLRTTSAADSTGKARVKAAVPAWNAVVQPTIRQTTEFTQGKQTPVFDDRYLSYLVYTTSDSGSAGAGPTSTTVSNLGQLYDINNVRPEALALSATMGNDADSYGRFLPDTKVNLELTLNRPGYVFLINRDDQDNAQMVSLTKNDLDFNSPDKMLDECYIDGQKTINVSDLYKITTSAREGEERWKAFLFTSKDAARTFATAWCELTRDKEKRVRRSSFKQHKLNRIERISVQGGENLLLTSELHYRVTGKSAN